MPCLAPAQGSLAPKSAPPVAPRAAAFVSSENWLRSYFLPAPYEEFREIARWLILCSTLCKQEDFEVKQALAETS